MTPVYLENADFVTFRQPDIWKTYLHKPDPNDILRIFADAGTGQILQSDVRRLASNQVKVFRKFLGGLRSMTPSQTQVLLGIAVFEVATCEVGSSNNCLFQPAVINSKRLRTVNKDVLPNFPTEEIFIDISDEDCNNLASILSLQSCPREEVLCQMVRCTSRVNRELTSLIIWIMDRWDEFQPLKKHLIINEIRNKPFIPLHNGRHSQASECFDPSDELLIELFSGRMDIFPASPFESNYRSILLELGLKTRSQVKEDEIRQCVSDVILKSNVRKGYALLKFLDENPVVLNGPLCNYLNNQRWVPVEHLIESDVYPSEYPQYNKCYNLLKPNEVISVALAPLVASTMPLVSNKYQRLTYAFKWELESHLLSEKVYSHLKNLVDFVSRQKNTGNRLDTSTVEKILHRIYIYMQNNLEYFAPFKNLDDKLIWTGTCFVTPSRISIQATRYSLEPYAFVLHPGFSNYKRLFKAFGAIEKFDDKTEPMLELFEEIKSFHETPGNLGLTSERMEHDRDLAIQVIECIIDLNKGNVTDEIRDRIFLPVAMQNSDCLQFASCNDVCYPNEEWLEFDEFEDIKLVHEKVSRKIYNCLDVIPLGQKISGAMSLLGFQQAGQKEDLTQKLRNILDSGYTENSIANEMIQNADDAGASEVRFMIDMRTNSLLKSRLLDKEMESWQGPALWVYNDSTFSDADFENITKIGGRTKESNPELIGKFGLGFNSVYHITDVPSFLSRGLVGFLDPHTIFLDSQIRDKRNPGIRIDLNRSKTTLKRFRNQFQPFHNIFGCNLFNTDEVNFEGALFRLPLRTIAIKSQISDRHFEENDVLLLMENVNKNAEKLLLFTQHVTKVSVYYLGANKEPQQAVQLFSATKTPKEYIKEINNSMKNLTNMEKFKMQNSILFESSQFLSNNSSNFPSSLTRLSVEHCLTNEGAFRYPTDPAGNSATDWLVCSCMGQSNSLELYKSDTSRFKIPCGGVALPLLSQPIQGEVFCFLPLSIPTSGIPLHINGNFEVSSDRRNLWRRGTLFGVRDLKADWNDAIFADIINRSYVSLLTHRQAQQCLTTCSTYDLWPNESQISMQSEYLPLLKAFYKAIVYGIDNSGDKPCVFQKYDKWLNIDEIVIYKPHTQAVADDVKKVLQRFIATGMYVVDIPENIIKGFERADCSDAIQKRIYNEERFFKEIFFPNINAVEIEMRDKLTMHIIDHYKQPSYRKLLENRVCIPTGCPSTSLKKISDLVHPYGKVSALFEPEEYRFPLTNYQRDETRMEVMVELGMKKDDLSLPELLERARILEGCHSERQHKIEKMQHFMEFLETKCGILDQKFIDDLRCIKMIPVSKRPIDFPAKFPWYGDDCDDFLCATDLYPFTYSNLVGFVKPIVHEQVFRWCRNAENVSRVFNLSIQMRAPSSIEVTQQLKRLTNISNEHLLANEAMVLKMCKNIYSVLERELNFNIKFIDEFLTDDWAWVWHGEGFACTGSVCINKGTVNLKPYFYSVHQSLRCYKQLFMHCNVPQEQSERVSDLISILHKIKEKHDRNMPPTAEVEHDRNLVIEILNVIKRHKTKFDVEHRKNILLPIESGEALRLVTPEECCFCDDWFKCSLSSEHHENIVHQDVTNAVAEFFGVTPLSIKLSHSYEIGITQFGQEETLTQRLHNILEDYQAIDIPKEMIQNADDAKATEVKFLLDLSSSSNTHGLLDKEMALCHGPALCVFNNAMFTENDFENIIKLGGQTKLQEKEKIGKFGLGFNSVYHITDVPSFISNGRLTIFDPHRFHLKNHIRSGAPGIQMNFRDNPSVLDRFSNQFLPYKNVFGCDLRGKSFNGTLFRLPLRSANQVQECGKISKDIFDEQKITNLITKFQNQAGEILIFTKHVKKMSIYRRNGYDDEPTFICSVMREPIIERCIENIYKIRINVEFLNKKSEQADWIIQTVQGNREALQIARSPNGVKHGLNPCGGLAYKCCSKNTVSGLVFCFLPLSIPPSGLPIHINAKFSVTPDRRSLRKKGSGDDTTLHSEWNDALMKDVTARGYIMLLSEPTTRTMILTDVSTIHKKDGIYSLWPRTDYVHTDIHHVVHCFYQAVVYGINQDNETDLPQIFHVGQHWYTFSEINFLDADLKCCPILPQIKDVLVKQGFVIVDLPDYIRKSFVDSECSEEIRMKTFTHRRFFEEQFFPNIKELPVDVVNVVVLYLLQHNDSFEWINEKLKSIPCIPSTPDGARKVPSDLIDHTCYKIALMYLPEDGKFPLGKEFRAPEIIGKLRSLGMAYSSIPFEHVIERCQSIELFLQSSRSNEIIQICQNRANAILLYIESINKVNGSFRERIQELHDIKFIPVETHPPKDYPLTWANTKDLFLSPKCVYSSKVKEYVGAVAPVAKELKCSMLTDMLLKIKVNPDLADVIEQLKLLIATEFSNVGRVFKMYMALMEEVKKNMNTKSVVIKEALQNLQVVLCSGKFVKIENVTLSCKREFQPYLYRLPTELRIFCNIFTILGIKEDFSASTLLDIIYFLQDKYNKNALNEEDFSVAIDLVHSFATHKTCDDERQMLIPDSHRHLRPANELSFCLHDSLDDDIGDEILCHELIPHSVADKLGVKDIRLNILSRNEIKLQFGTKFGQVQKLTSRISEILEGYPCDEAILKELLQNADDAGAEEINFIYDPRQHPDKKVFCESWKQTLGPALCVFNNKPFTESDLKGIQDLGIGSKSTHPDKTGQYGIGFNSVYHLTDCPTFLSNDDTLCVFDPHCAFIENATVDAPGRQFDIDPRVNKLFRDALSCFRLDSLPNKGCTMFRFPLRTTEMSSYAKLNQDSVMSRELFDGKKLQGLLDTFKLKAFDMLLYLNNVKKITVSHINENQHKMKTDYSVKAELSEEDEQKRHEFYSYVKECAKKTTLEDIEVKDITYEIKISDSSKKTEVWLVNQRIGSAGEIPINLSSAYKEGDLKLLPRGGVAARLRGSDYRNSFCTYCFLPIPIDPKLPVSVNGHFSLDPSRRNLSNTSQNSDWNLFVMGEVISYSYSELLRHLRNRKLGPVNDKKSQITCTSQCLHNILKSYWRYFPNIYFVHSDWKRLAEHVFLNILRSQMPMFPVVQRRDDIIAYKLDDNCVIQYMLEWLPATGVTGRKAYFDKEDNQALFYKMLSAWSETEKKNMLLKAILQHIGFNITIVPKHIYQDLNAAVDILMKNVATKSQSHGIELVSADTVVHFLKSDFNPGPIPCHISESRLQSKSNYFVLLNYIDNNGNLKDGSMSLEGLPLLLTQDSWLRKFSSTNTYFLSRKHSLLPNCWSEFVHENAQDHFSDKSSHVKHLGISNLVERLHFNLDPQFNACDKVSWNPNNDVIPNKAWIQTLWDFLKEEFEKLQCHDDRCAYVKRLMGNWAVIPVKVTLPSCKLNQYLMPFSSADSVLHSNITDGHIRDALAKMELPVVDCTLFQKPQASYFYGLSSQSNITDFIKRFIATASTPERVLTSLVSLLDNNDRSFDVLDNGNKKNILLFFVRFIGSSINKQHSSKLKKLPCYLSIHGEHIILDRNYQHFVLHSGIPEVEREKWVARTNAEFIEEDSSLTKLHELLGLTTSTEEDVYKEFILPAFNAFTHKARVKHLQRIQALLPFSFSKADRNAMISYMNLKTMPLVSHEGQPIKRICDFFDSSIPLFKCMLEPEMFLPEPFCDYGWNTFMRELGLITEPTQQHVLEFARKIELDMIWYDLKKHTEKSKAVIDHIAQSGELMSDNYFLQHLRCIKFIAPHTVDTNLAALHKQYKEHSEGRVGIAYNGAMTSSNKNLVWTSANLLPYYAVPNVYLSPKRLSFRQLLPALNASETPSVDIVIKHIKNLCTNLKDEYGHSKKSASTATSVKCQDHLRRVMKDIYTFLCGKLLEFDGKIVTALNDEPIMLVDNDRHLIKAKFTVKTIKKELVLVPYIYEIPEYFVPYMGLFSRLGAQEKPTIWQCSQLLAMIHEDIKDETFRDNPNLMKMITFAVHKIFKSYIKEENNWLKDIMVLYLPNRSCQLIESSKLKYYDKPMFEVRMKEENDRNVLIDLKDVGLENDATEYIQKMPIHLQPCKFSNQVQEIMTTKPEENMCPYANERICEQLNIIRRQLHSIEFRNGIYRLIKHEANNKGLKLPEHLRSDVPALSKDYLSIRCLKKLETHLVKSDEVIEGSTIDKQCFLLDETTAEHTHKTIFIRHHDSGKYDLLKLSLADIICKLTGELISNNFMVAMIIFCDLTEIQTQLSDHNILRSNAQASERMSVPDLGSQLPDYIVESLDNDPFNTFTEGEYVVYELGESGDEVYVYAKILRCIIRKNSELNSISMVYEIDIGRESTIEVSALHLYKWVLGNSRTDVNHHKEMALQAMVNMSTGSESERGAPTYRQRAPTPPLSENLEETKNQVSDNLEEIWKLDEDERKKAVKRLYLKWHPDKNPGREEFCSEVFKHLKNEIDRLERGLPRQRKDAEATRTNYTFRESGRWNEFYTRWDRRAGRDRRWREYYGSSYNRGASFSSGSSWTHTGFTNASSPPPRPMPDQGRIWQKQAREDLKAARNDIDGYPSYEWVAYKCLQSAEKSMKAAILSHTGNNSRTHDITWLAITVSSLPGCSNNLRQYVNELCINAKDHNRARYPRLFDDQIPHDLFNRNNADKCISNTKAILDMMDIVIASQ
ncbi:sacsin-like [Anneissia japonica]|uniref:sacsin-like n=1 Tax=Anneissia japonica TaxID=1529436 RepID=UPI0014255036|nr:sacsin-like [Anneissia japonica]